MDMLLKDALSLALNYVKQANYQKAIDIFQQILQQQPEQAVAMHFLGVSYYNLFDKEKGLALMEKAYALSKDNPEFSHNLGSIYNLEKQYDKARFFLEKAVSLAPDNFIFIGNLVSLYVNLDLNELAYTYGMKCLALKSEYADKNFKKAYSQYAVSETENYHQYNKNDLNVIVFCLFGDKRLYTRGAIINAWLAKYIYPTWEVRFYVDKTVPQVIIDKLVMLGANILYIPEYLQGYHRLLSRYLVMEDKTVTRFISRDCDSRLNVREKVAVDEWVNSGRSFHIMRDSLKNCELILAGMWGGIPSAMPSILAVLKNFETKTHAKWVDQNFSSDFLWPLIKDHAMIHDAFYDFYKAKKFPTIGDSATRFVGMIESWDLDVLDHLALPKEY
jgi:hypothetical protein